MTLLFVKLLDSLSSYDEQLNISDTTLREKWSKDELIFVYVQEEKKLNKKTAEKAYLTTTAFCRKSSKGKKSRSRTGIIRVIVQIL